MFGSSFTPPYGKVMDTGPKFRGSSGCPSDFSARMTGTSRIGASFRSVLYLSSATRCSVAACAIPTSRRTALRS